MKQGLIYILLFFFLIEISGLITGCANIIPPTGGPRDSLPPRLITVNPTDSSLNFNEKRIVFYFNEYVELQDARENMIVSPTPKIDPVVEYKLHTVTVRLKDTLEVNTTYSINFGNAIRDINEGNEIKDFTYVFSTGTTLDDKQLSGKVLFAENGKVDSTLTVLLHRSSDDSSIIKDRPRYIARLTADGNFNFRNLPAGTFYLYALKDEGGTRRYLSKSQLFAFSGKPVIINDNTAPDTLYAYMESEEEPRRSGILSTVKEKNNQDRRLPLQSNLEGGQQDLLGNFELLPATPLRTFDSAKLRFTDIAFQPITNYLLTPDSLFKKLTLTYAWKPDSTYHIIIDTGFAEDSTGRKTLRKDTVTFKAKKEADYGSLKLKFPMLDLGRNPVLQLVLNDKIVFSDRLSNREFFRKLFNPGDYEIRILYDENRNGKWDPGSFFGKHLQPEKVRAIDIKVNVKANWDKDYTIEL